MNIKSQLCYAVGVIKSSEGLTYDQLIVQAGNVVLKSQLISILKHRGKNVSVEVIEKVLHGLGREVKICISVPDKGDI